MSRCHTVAVAQIGRSKSTKCVKSGFKVEAKSSDLLEQGCAEGLLTADILPVVGGTLIKFS